MHVRPVANSSVGFLRIKLITGFTLQWVQVFAAGDECVPLRFRSAAAPIVLTIALFLLGVFVPRMVANVCRGHPVTHRLPLRPRAVRQADRMEHLWHPLPDRRRGRQQTGAAAQDVAVQGFRLSAVYGMLARPSTEVPVMPPPSVCLSMIPGRLGTRTACAAGVGTVGCRMRCPAFLCHVVRGRRSRCRDARGRSRELITYWLELRCYCAMPSVPVGVSIILPYNGLLRNVLVVAKPRRRRRRRTYYARRLWATCQDGIFEGVGDRQRR